MLVYTEPTTCDTASFRQNKALPVKMTDWTRLFRAPQLSPQDAIAGRDDGWS